MATLSNRTIRYVLLFSSVVLMTLSTASSDPIKDMSCDDDQYKQSLHCFLRALQLPIPDQEFKEWPFTLSIHSMSCSELYIQDVSVQTPSPRQNCQMFVVTVGEVSAICHGQYLLTGGISGNLQATVAPLPAVPALQLRLEVNSTAETIPSESNGNSSLEVLSPTKFTTQDCHTYLAATGIHFTGSISAKLIQVFEKPVEHYLRETLQKTLCPLLKEQLDPFLNLYLDKFNEWKNQYLPSASAATATKSIQSEAGTTALQRRLTRRGSFTKKKDNDNNGEVINPLNWNVPETVVELLNDQLETHWQDGWLLFTSQREPYCDTDCVPFTKGFSGIIPQHNQQIPFVIDKRVPVFDERLQLYIPRVQVSGIHDINQVSTFGLMTNHSAVILVPNMELTFMDSRNKMKLVFDVTLNISSLSANWGGLVQVQNWDKLKLPSIIRSLEDYINTGDTSNLSCVLSTIVSVELIELIAAVTSESLLIKPVVNSTNIDPLERDVDIALSKVSTQVLQGYAELWTLLGQGLVKGPVKELINKVVKDWLASNSQTDANCDPLKLAYESDDSNDEQPWWLDFTKWKWLYEFNDFLKSHTDGLNHYMDCIQRTIQHMVQSQLVLKSNNHASFFAKNWDTLTDVNLLEPRNKTVLGSKATIGSSQTMPEITLSLEVDNATIIGNATINITLFGSAHAESAANIKYDLNIFENVSAASFLQNGQCGMVPAVEFHILPETSVQLESIGVNVSIDVAESNEVVHLSSLDYGDLVVQEAIDWGISSASAWVNKAFDDWFAFSPGTCPGVNVDRSKQNKGKTSDDWIHYSLVWVALVIVVLGQVSYLLLSRKDNQETDTMATRDVEYSMQEPLLRDSSEVLMEPASLILEEQSDIVHQTMLDNMRNLDESVLSEVREQLWEDEQGQERDENDQASRKCKSLFQSSKIHELVRFLFPIGVVGTMVILLASNLNVGASVNLSLNLGERTFELPGLFEFSLVNTVTEFYKAGIYPLLFLVVGFSGIWPYLKLLLLLHAWVTPYVFEQDRETQLLQLDALSKFSLVDTYVLVVMIVSFRLHMDLATNYGLDVIITPEFGFYAFLLATVLSLLLGHGMVYFHRKEARIPRRSYDSLQDDFPESILEHVFKMKEARAPLSKFSQVVFFTGCLVAIACLLVGFFQPSFAFEVGGLAGMVLGKESKRKVYSLHSMGRALSNSAQDPMSFGTLFLETAYFFFAMITPLAGLISLLVLFLKPMTLKHQRWLVVGAEIANAWSAIEVFLLSICTAILQIATFASFMVGDKCSLVNQFLEDLAKRNDVIIPGLDPMPVCFTVHASVDWNKCWYLIVGALLNSLLMSSGLKLAHTVVEERSMARGEYTSDHLNGESERSSTWLEWFFAVPALRCIVFGSELEDSIEEQDDFQNPNSFEEEGSEEVSETEQAEWRQWF